MINTFDDIIKVAEAQAHPIPYIENNTNFWMIRCKQGIFYKEFVDEEFIGWNVLTKNELLMIMILIMMIN